MKGAVFGVFGLYGGCTASGYGFALLHLAVGVVLLPDGLPVVGSFVFPAIFRRFGLGRGMGLGLV